MLSGTPSNPKLKRYLRCYQSLMESLQHPFPVISCNGWADTQRELSMIALITTVYQACFQRPSFVSFPCRNKISAGGQFYGLQVHGQSLTAIPFTHKHIRQHHNVWARSINANTAGLLNCGLQCSNGQRPTFVIAVPLGLALQSDHML